MSTTTLDRIVSERNEARDSAIALAESDSFDPTDPTYLELQTRAERLDAQVDTLEKAYAARQSAQQVQRASSHAVEQRSASSTPLTLADAFIDSPQHRGYQFHGVSSRVTVDMPLQMRAPINTYELPGLAFMEPANVSGKTPPRLQTPLLDLITAVQVSSGTVEWVEYPAAAPLAAIVPEGDLKPEAVLTASNVSKTLPTIAHHVVVTRQALEDSSQLRDWINGNLVRGVADKLEAEAAAALLAATNIVDVYGADLMASIRVGYGQVQAAGYRPDVVLLNPADYATLDLDVFAVTGLPVSRNAFWGLTPVAVGAVTEGEAYVMDSAAAMTMFYRAGTDVFISDSHSDFFLRNQFVILAERRALSAVTTPEAAAHCLVGTPPAQAAKARGGK